MIPVTLAQLARDCVGQVVGTPTTEILDLTTDTRAITPGALFAAVKGARVAGASLAGGALKTAASAILTSDPVTAVACGAKPEDVVVVDDVQAAIGKLARENLRRGQAVEEVGTRSPRRHQRCCQELPQTDCHHR